MANAWRSNLRSTLDLCRFIGLLLHRSHRENRRRKTAKKKHPPPAKIKYDKSHPIVSIRVTPDLKKKLDDIKKMSDRSPADVLKEAMGLQIHSTCSPYEKGRLVAEITYCVTYKCYVCGKPITISTPDEKKAVAQYMKEHGWAHGECLKK